MLRFIALGAIVGVVFGVASAFLGLSVWLFIPVLPVVVFLGVFRSKLRNGQKVPHGEVPCPRCGPEPRVASGWCSPCTSELEASAVEPVHPVGAFTAAVIDQDLDRAAQSVASRVTVYEANGSRFNVSRGIWRRSTQIVDWAYRDGTNVVEAMHGDPAAPDVAWVRTHSIGHARLGFPSLDLRAIIRYRVVDGLISEMATMHALPGAEGGEPAAPAGGSDAPMFRKSE